MEGFTRKAFEPDAEHVQYCDIFAAMLAPLSALARGTEYSGITEFHITLESSFAYA
jgi:hypothetical protein